MVNYTPNIGVCYYPEHWPEDQWQSDAERMVQAGISQVRLAEFSWSKIEARRGEFSWGWLDRAVEILAQAGLSITMCTPTATPPKWLVDEMPDMLAYDADGRPRGFGSRRHYSFAHKGYCGESRRITRLIAERYGQHPAVTAWQTDNEYGCHDTAISWCPAARDGFRLWLADTYQNIDRLNDAWGTAFWSMRYASFDEIELPHLTVTEANPSHTLDFYRFSTEMVRQFNAEQVDILRQLSPGRPIAHNYMGMFDQFDHRPVAASLDIASWDSYPIGMLQNMASVGAPDTDMLTDCLRVGDPDFQAFHHDLYRGMGRLWVMEQQPGPVNWARTNAVPADGAVRMWSFEAAAHGAELISYFRWRQVPFAQEQMHAGLCLPDGRDAPAMKEAKQFIDEAGQLSWDAPSSAKIALIYEYEASWMAALDGQSADFSHLRLVLDVYRAIRQNGGSVDIVGSAADLSGYSLIILPAVMTVSDKLADALHQSTAKIFMGPRTGAKTANFQIPANLPPGNLQSLAGFVIEQIDALPADQPVSCKWRNHAGRLHIWLERGQLMTGASAEGETESGLPLLIHNDRTSYLTGWVETGLMTLICAEQMRDAGLDVHEMPEYLRVRQSGEMLIFTNYGPRPVAIPDTFSGRLLLGERILPPAGVSILSSDN